MLVFVVCIINIKRNLFSKISHEHYLVMFLQNVPMIWFLGYWYCTHLSLSRNLFMGSVCIVR